MRRKFISAILVSLLCSLGLSQPSAMAGDLTDYGNFTNSSAYQELSTLLAQNVSLINNSSSNQITISTSSSHCAILGGCQEPTVLKTSGKKVYLKVQTAVGPITSITVNKVNYISLGYACAQYYPDGWTDAFYQGCGGADTIKRVKKYLRNNSLQHVAFSCPTDFIDYDCVDERYLKLLSGDQTLSGSPNSSSLNSFASIDGLMFKFLSGLDSRFLNYTRTGINQNAFFSDVIKTESQSTPGETDYSFSVMVSAFGGEFLDSTDLSFTFDSQGKLVKTILKYDGLLDLTKTYSYQIGQPVEINAPASSLVTSKAKFWNANHSFMATAELLRLTGSLSIAAKTIAKKAKRAVNYADLMAAAKSKHLTYQKLKSGVKVTKKYRGVAGSMCVSLVRGRFIGKEC